MKALAIHQPYAWLVVHGHKKEEFRPWLTHFRGPFLVHATKAIDKEKVAQERSRLARKGIVLPDELPRGGIVGVVTLVDCVRDDDDSLTQRLLDRLFGQEPPYYSFILQDPRPLPFVKYRGQQKFFNVPDNLDGLEIDF
jgi:hypothetical protein